MLVYLCLSANGRTVVNRCRKSWTYLLFCLIEEKAKGSLTLAMGKCLWFSVKIKVCQSSLSSP